MTLDSPAAGLTIAQPARGFRYTSDAMWLVGLALQVTALPARALDLGTGSGVLAMLLAWHGIPTVGVDSRSDWAPLWEITLARSATRASVDLEIADVCSLSAGSFDLVVSNPPYFPANTGPVAPDPWKRAARTESTATLADFLAAARASLAQGGHACFIVPREREEEVLRCGLVAQRWIRIGRRRSLFALREADAPHAIPESAPEGSPLARSLEEAATGRATG